MWKYRAIYVLALIGTALFLLLHPLWFSSYLMVTLLLLIPLDFFISLPGMLSPGQVSIAAPEVVEQGQDERLVVTMHKKKRYPISGVKFLFKATGEDFFRRQRLFVGSEHGGWISQNGNLGSESGNLGVGFGSLGQGFDRLGQGFGSLGTGFDSRCELKIDTSCSGLFTFEAQRFWAVSFLGLFCFRVRSGAGNKGALPGVKISVLVLPLPIKPTRTDALPFGIVLKPKPGGGFSDEFDLRPFRLGDTIRSVHWKVSAKLDSLIIREPLVPLSESRLFQVVKWDGARERDLILGRLLWISESFISRSLQYYVCFEANGAIAEITSMSDLYDFLRMALDSTVEAGLSSYTGPVRFTWVYRVDAAE